MFDVSDLPHVWDVVSGDDAELVAAIAEGARFESAALARQLVAMVDLFDRRQDSATAANTSLWAVDVTAAVAAEIAAARAISKGRAEGLLSTGLTLRTRFPRLGGEFLAGRVTYRVVCAVIARTELLDDTTVGLVEGEVLTALGGLGRLSEKKLAALIDFWVMEIDYLAVRAKRDVDKERFVDFDVREDGMTDLSGILRTPDAAVLNARLDQIADTVCRNDPRPKIERRADAVGALACGLAVLDCGCGDPDCPTLTPAAAGSDANTATQEPGTAAGGTEKPGTEKSGAEKPETDDSDGDDGDDGAGDRGRSDSGGHGGGDNGDGDGGGGHNGDGGGGRRATPTPGSRPGRPPGGADIVVNVIADKTTLSGGSKPALLPGFGPLRADVLREMTRGMRVKFRDVFHPRDSAPEPGYRPSTELARFVLCRDLTCRFPGCDVPADKCQIDHTVPHPHGPTHASNLKLLCGFHHLVKTFYDGPTGWFDMQRPDGTLIWRSPTGRFYTTTPGGALYFPMLAEPTGTLILPARPDNPNKTTKMPLRARTRHDDKAARIAYERKRNFETIPPPDPPPF